MIYVSVPSLLLLLPCTVHSTVTFNSEAMINFFPSFLSFPSFLYSTRKPILSEFAVFFLSGGQLPFVPLSTFRPIFLALSLVYFESAPKPFFFIRVVGADETWIHKNSSIEEKTEAKGVRLTFKWRGCYWSGKSCWNGCYFIVTFVKNLCCWIKLVVVAAVVGLSLSESLDCRRCYEKDKEKWRRGKVWEEDEGGRKRLFQYALAQIALSLLPQRL